MTRHALALLTMAALALAGCGERTVRTGSDAENVRDCAAAAAAYHRYIELLGATDPAYTQQIASLRARGIAIGHPVFDDLATKQPVAVILRWADYCDRVRHPFMSSSDGEPFDVTPADWTDPKDPSDGP